MSASASRCSPPNAALESAAHRDTPHQAIAYIKGVNSSSARAGFGSRRSSNPHSANRPTLSPPVREAVSTTPSTRPAISAAAQPSAKRRISNRPTTATLAHISRLLRWLGWRKLPIARPGLLGTAIQWPSARPGANTCTKATTRFSRPAPTQAQQKSANSVSRFSLWPAALPASSSTLQAANSPPADNARLAGSPRAMNDHSTAPATKASASTNGHTPRPGRCGLQATTKPPHSAQASAWFRNVGDGATL